MHKSDNNNKRSERETDRTSGWSTSYYIPRFIKQKFRIKNVIRETFCCINYLLIVVLMDLDFE